MNNQDPNPYLKAPETHVSPQAREVVEELATDECWRLLGLGELGRLAVADIHGRPDVFPVNYLVHGEAVFLRSAPGSKLMDITAHPLAAFEVDGATANSRWSVVLRGRAHRVNTDAEIEQSGILDLASWSPTHKYNYIRITADTVSGRRFARRLPDTAQSSSAPASRWEDDSGNESSRSH